MGHGPAHGGAPGHVQPSSFHRQPLLRKRIDRVVRGNVLSDAPWHSKAVARLVTRAMDAATSKSLVLLLRPGGMRGGQASLLVAPPAVAVEAGV